MSQKIDITSTAIEKGIDIAKDFLDKLIMPTVEETGLLIRDQVTMWKFKNQVKMLNKAKAYCEANNISPKTISLKILCPLLEYSGLEEDDELQDKWAILLSNMVDSEQNIENHVFPYILSQISSNEFFILESVYNEKISKVRKLTLELEDFRNDKPKIEEEYKSNIASIEEKISAVKLQSHGKYHEDIWKLQKEKMQQESKLSSLKYKERSLLTSISNPEILPHDSLKEFEFSNLIRLGVIKERKEFYANSQTLEIPNEREEQSRYTRVDLDIDVDSDTDIILTQLGELFVQACIEKMNNN